jgi:DNA-3-methyladenine glycosylase
LYLPGKGCTMKLEKEMGDAMKLGREFYQADGVTLAQRLLGKVLVHRTPEGVTKGRIVETEAYMGPIDKGAHSYRGRPDGRVSIQYGPGGYAYLYLIYGMYTCMNVVAAPEGQPQCVLLRALEPLEGLELMNQRRGGGKKKKDLCSGPGKLCQAMGLSRAQYGWDLTGENFYVEDTGEPVPEIQATPRIHIEYAEEARDFLWRFVVKDSPFLSIKAPKQKKATNAEISVDMVGRSD